LRTNWSRGRTFGLGLGLTFSIWPRPGVGRIVLCTIKLLAYDTIVIFSFTFDFGLGLDLEQLVSTFWPQLWPRLMVQALASFLASKFGLVSL